MDYIGKKIAQKIRFHESLNEKHQLKIYYQVQVEYMLMFLFAYLWNTNYFKLSAPKKAIIANKVYRPTIGDIVGSINILDIEKTVRSTTRINSILNNYPSIRNEKIGHGYVFEDGLDDYIEAFNEISNQLFEHEIFRNTIDLVLVKKFDGSKFSGINFKESTEYIPWISPKEVHPFEIDNVYCIVENKYFRLTPFINIASEDEFYLFSAITERLSGKVKYNRINRTDVIYSEWPELAKLFVEENSGRKRSVNGTIINEFKRNYRKYINVGIKEKIKKFLIDNKASVCATIWGHGGVGKTASIQSICDDLVAEEKKYFEYIIFLSAKDRFFNFYTGEIEDITDDKITTFEEIIEISNKIIGNEDDIKSSQKIMETQERILFIIDDFETFVNSEKEKIEIFIKKLDINHHKVIITTRANLIIGEEIPTNEFNENETIQFLLEVFNVEYAESKAMLNEAILSNNKSKVQLATSGRPIFIYQFASIVAQRGFEVAVWKQFSSSKVAREFLYGRVFEYLSPTAKNIFPVISKLVKDDKETNLIDKLQYILNLEDDSNFSAAIKELVKIRIIEVIDNRFFRVYSKELWEVMNDYYAKRDAVFKSSVTFRLNHVSNDRELSIEGALLANADASRFSKNEEEVISLYRQLLNRMSTPKNIKIKALLNLTSYLSTDKGKTEEAINVFEDYIDLFPNELDAIKMYSTYCWATGDQDKSIKILLDYFARNGKVDYQHLELFGLLLANRSNYWISKREETKNQYSLRQITSDEYRGYMKEQQEMFLDIFKKQGHILFNNVRGRDFSRLKPGIKQNISNGLYQLIEVCIRIKKYEFANEICHYGLEHFPQHYIKLINQKMDRITRFVSMEDNVKSHG